MNAIAMRAAISSPPWPVRPSGQLTAGVGRYSWPRIAVVLALVAVWAVVLPWPDWTHWTALTAVNVVVALLFALTGLLLAREPGQRGLAWALVLTGICRPLDYIDAWGVGPFPFYALVFGGIDRVFGAWALLRYPNPSLSRGHRRFLIAFAAWMLVTRTLVGVTATPQWASGGPVWMPELLPDVRLATVLSIVGYIGEGLCGVVLIVLLVRRLVSARRLDRVVLTPVVVAGIAATVAAIVSGAGQQEVGASNAPVVAYLAEGLVDIALPLAFLVAFVQRALLIRNITWLVAEISGGASINMIRDALRATLQDPTLDVIDLSAPDSPMLDGPKPVGAAAFQGEPPPAAEPAGQDRLVEFVHSESGEPIAVIIADPSLDRYRGLFDVAVRTSALALQTAQAQAAAAQAKLAEVHASRARIIEAAHAERQRIERDLHDGVQQRILGLAAQLSAAVAKSGDPAARAAFAGAREGLKEILAELRELAHGIYPPVLTQSGLAAALEEVADRLPLPVRLDVPATRVPPPVEAAAYFVACEALANVVKHASASEVTLTVTVGESEVAMEITDNGVGGAGPQGHGLANIADRVSALDGRLVIDSPPGAGTRLVVTIPCG
jgi:signal transduction histidine kinase